MKNKVPSRRHFLKGSLLASGGLLVLNPIYGSDAANLLAKTDAANSSFCDSREIFLGKQIEISGRILDSSGLRPQAGISMEYWHVSPGTGEKINKGKLITDANGFYRIKSDFPGREIGRHATIHFEVSNGKRSNKATLKISSVNAFITDEHWVNHKQLPGELLFPKFNGNHSNTIEFNFSL